MSKTGGRLFLVLIIGFLVAGQVALAGEYKDTTGLLEQKIDDGYTVESISFSETPAPTSQYANGEAGAAFNMSIPYTTSVVTVSYSNGTTVDYPLEYRMLFKSDDVVQTGPHAGEYYGGIINGSGAPILDPVAANNPFYFDVTSKALAAGLNPAYMDQLVADTPDGAALLRPEDAPESETAAEITYLNHFEYVTWDGNHESQYGKNPMFIAKSTLVQDLITGLLSLKSYDKINFSAPGQKGLWIPCAASASQWNTFLGSEEYEADQWNFDMNATEPAAWPLDFNNTNLVEAFQVKFGDATARPYDYGYVTETSIDEKGGATAVKHYATGRWAREVIRMMPDRRTYYSGDDGKSTLLLMGIADKPYDLSAVTLYASKFTQTSPRSPLPDVAPGEPGAVQGAELGAGTLSWIRLGHATDGEIKALIDAGLKSTDIFDITLETAPGVLPAEVDGVVGTGPIDPDTGNPTVTADDMTEAGYKRVFDYYHRHTKGKAEWLRLRPGMDQAAAFLETRRYAAYLGATSEWTKMDGVALNAADRKAYIAISYQYDSMTDGVGDIQMGLLTAGNTYELTMEDNITDTTGSAIRSAWVATSIAAIPALKGLDNAYAVPLEARRRLAMAVTRAPLSELFRRREFVAAYNATLSSHKRIADAEGNLCATSNVANPDNLKFSASYRTLLIGEDSNCHVNNFVWAFNVDTGKLTRILSLPLGAEATGLMAVDNMNGYIYFGANYQHPGDSGVGAPPATLVNEVEAANPAFAAERNRSGGVGYLHIMDMPRMESFFYGEGTADE
jgi:hypothetical protein